MNSVYTQDISSYQVQQYAFKTNFYQILEDENSTSYSFPMHTTGYLTTSYWIVYISYIRDLSTNFKRMNHFKKLYEAYIKFCMHKILCFSRTMCVWCSSLDILQYYMGRSVCKSKNHLQRRYQNLH